jgi:hypothetical protein
MLFSYSLIFFVEVVSLIYYGGCIRAIVDWNLDSEIKELSLLTVSW